MKIKIKKRKGKRKKKEKKSKQYIYKKGYWSNEQLKQQHVRRVAMIFLFN